MCINSPYLAQLWDKSILSLIENEHIPKTYLLNSSTKDITLQNKDALIIKPSRGYEWNNISIWLEHSDEDRNTILHNIVNQDTEYIVQTYINTQKREINYYDTWSIHTTNAYYDFCPHIFVKEWEIIWNGLILCRYSENRILNVACGWGIGYWILKS